YIYIYITAAYSECEKKFNGLDILVNNAGIIDKEIRNMEAVNFEGPVRGTELAIKKMGKHNGGKGGFVVNISSIAGLLPFPILPYYAGTKAATIQF
ncbi:15-hydroxyprostaglandin dehydrogenase [NAD(+)], partial [Armadillidium vulgare]